MGGLIIANATTTLTFKSGVAVNLSGPMKLSSGGQINLSYQRFGHVETLINQPLNLYFPENQGKLGGWVHWMEI